MRRISAILLFACIASCNNNTVTEKQINNEEISISKFLSYLKESIGKSKSDFSLEFLIEKEKLSCNGIMVNNLEADSLNLDFKNYNFIKTFGISFSEIKKLNFKCADSIKEIRFCNNFIKSLPDFSIFKSASIIKADNNHFVDFDKKSVIEKLIIEGLPQNIQSLILSNNKLKSITIQNPEKYSKLCDLDLSNNEISTLDPSIYNLNIYYLKLQGNSHLNFQVMKFKNLKSIKVDRAYKFTPVEEKWFEENKVVVNEY